VSADYIDPETGEEFTAEEAQWLIDSGEYQFADDDPVADLHATGGPITPDDDIGGYRGRDLWSDNQVERSQQRADYMLRRIRGEFG
jgi:hypothetical protein